MTEIGHGPRILLTGPPGCGKTTVILRTLDLLRRPARGFYTQEVRVGGGRGPRVGFDVIALDGGRGVLARVGAPGPRVGKYGVDLRSFEAVGVRALEEGLRDLGTLLVLDELGKMELLSETFTALLPRVFAAQNPLLGTILHRAHPVADRYRRAAGVTLVEVTATNRGELPRELARRFA